MRSTAVAIQGRNSVREFRCRRDPPFSELRLFVPWTLHLDLEGSRK